MQHRLYSAQLDGLRFFAFLLVFIHHHPSCKGVPIVCVLHNYGWVGVDLFFALSAFLFTFLLNAEMAKTGTLDLKKFYLRRVLRICPLYYLFIVFSMLVYLFWHGGPWTGTFLLRVLGLFSFTDNILSGFMGYNLLPFAPHLWTISYEVQFYIIIPAAILIFSRMPVRRVLLVLAAIFATLFTFRLLLIRADVPHPAIWVLPATHFESMVLGMVIGYGGFNFLLKAARPIYWFILGIVLTSGIFLFPNVDTISPLLMATYALAGIGPALILFAALHGRGLRRLLSWAPFVYLGKRSYGLYVYHFLGIHLTDVLTGYAGGLPSGKAATFVYALAITTGISALSYRFVEAPFLRRKMKFELVASRPV